MKNRWHVPTQVVGAVVAILSWFLGHNHGGRQFAPVCKETKSHSKTMKIGIANWGWFCIIEYPCVVRINPDVVVDDSGRGGGVSQITYGEGDSWESEEEGGAIAWDTWESDACRGMGADVVWGDYSVSSQSA